MPKQQPATRRLRGRRASAGQFLSFSLSMMLTGSTAIAADGALDEAAMARGFSTVDATCFSCHSPDAAEEQRIAPPMFAIMRRYRQLESDYEGFRKAMVDFVNDPSPGRARMPGAVERFGVMPKMAFDPEVLNDVAYYLYHTEPEAPAWFASHYAEHQARYLAAANAQRESLEDYRRYGQQLAMQTKTVLGSNMKQSMQMSGVDGTVSFCKTRAAPIATEMSTKLGASIYRVSDRPRNPDNAASDRELQVMAEFREAMARGEAPTSAAHDLGDRVVGYYPVVTNAMCLKCHGQPGSDIAPSTLAIIDAEYPDDQATGYGSGELRGLFVVEMMKSNVPEGDAP